MAEIVKINLSKQGTAALWELLINTPVKGSRVEARKHRNAMLGLKAGAMKPIVNTDGSPEETDRYDICGGEVALKDEALEYVEDILDDAVKAGVKGNLGEGVGELYDEIERVFPPEAAKK